MKYNLIFKELTQYFIKIVISKALICQLFYFTSKHYCDVEKDKTLAYIGKLSRKAF